MDFETTMTEAEFRRPLLDAAEERLACEARGDNDLVVDGLKTSLLGKLLLLVAGRRS
jgi:hypothetical protein